MSAPDLPLELKTFLAQPMMREHHALWHFVRSFWAYLAPERKLQLAHWAPPNGRMQGLEGSGVDFLGMHRDMVQQVRKFVADQNLVADVLGWTSIPWDPADPDWPMPPTYPGNSDPAWKEPAATAQFKQEVATQYDSTVWMKSHTLDQLGIAIENGIHPWMHMHWSAKPWFKNQPGQDMNDPQNDYLGCPYSSHINKHFWKLHGWIDDLITRWSNIHGEDADLSSAWMGPGHMHMGGMPLMTEDEIKLACTIFSGNGQSIIAQLRNASSNERAGILASLVSAAR
jgi:hypothetical protein